MSALDQLLNSLRVSANVFHNGHYCGEWAVDTSGLGRMNFHVVSYGRCYFRAGEKTIQLEEGDAIFLPTDAAHYLSNSPNDDVETNQAVSLPFTERLEPDGTGLVCGNFGHQHPMFEKLLRQLPSYIVVRKQDNSTSADIINLMMNESRQSDQATNLLLNRLSDCLFFVLLREHIETESGVFAALVHPKLSKPMARIHQSVDEKLTLDDLASEAAMSRSAFAALFKEVTEQTPIEYIAQWRMTQAYRWLADEGISTLDAAIRTGYESEASFSKAFKRVMEMGPGQARKASI